MDQSQCYRLARVYATRDLKFKSRVRNALSKVEGTLMLPSPSKRNAIASMCPVGIAPSGKNYVFSYIKITVRGIMSVSISQVV